MNLIRDKFVVNSWQFVFSFRHKLSQIAHEFSINYYCLFSCLQPIKVSAPLMSSSARKNVLIVYIVHEATPKAPARAVSTVITILRTCFQFTFILVVV